MIIYRERERERDWRLAVLLYADDPILRGEPEEDVRVIIGCFIEVRKEGG